MSILDQFLSEITQSLRSKNGSRISELIHLDVENLSPDRRRPYEELNQQLKQQYPGGQDGRLDARLLERCKTAVPQDEFGSFSTSFSESIARYFRYLRDVDTADNLSKASEIRQLTSQCVTALGDSTNGVIMIPIVLSFSRTLSFIASYLDRNPHILKSTTKSNLPSSANDSSVGKVSFLEDTANVLRDAFIKCLAGSPGTPRTTRPTPGDKRVGIYLTANATLKLLFRARKIRNAQQILLSIDAQSPPLSFYPAAQRVTYLYYLGRYWFANNHFLRAATVLQAAYRQCHRDATNHRRNILVYLVASNLILGKLPNQQLFDTPEAAPLAQYFSPLVKIIKSGDIGAFHNFLSLSSPTSTWFLRRRILLQIRNRCAVLVWRALIRKCFVLAGFHGEDKKMPFLRLHVVRHAARFSMARAQTLASRNSAGGSSGDDDDANYIDPEFQGIKAAEKESGFDLQTGTYTTPEQVSSEEHFPPQSALPGDQQSPTIAEIESIILSLIQQGFLRGFLNRQPSNPGMSRFAIRGIKGRGPLSGFPDIYGVIVSGDREEGALIGWVREENVSGGMRAGGGGGMMGGGMGSLAGRRVQISGRPIAAG